MQIIKYAGIILLSGSISCYGAIISDRLKETYLIRNEIITLLKNIERGIIHGRIPVALSLRECPDGRLKASGFCQKILNSENTKAVIEESLSALSKEDKKMLVSFFLRLGKSQSSECELQSLRFIIDYFEKTQSQSEKDISTKASLYKKISIISALVAAIIFI